MRCRDRANRRTRRPAVERRSPNADDSARAEARAAKPGRGLPVSGVRTSEVPARAPHPSLGAGWQDRAREPGAALLVPPPARTRGWIPSRSQRVDRVQVSPARWAPDRRGAAVRDRCRSWADTPAPAGRAESGRRHVSTAVRGRPDRLRAGRRAAVRSCPGVAPQLAFAGCTIPVSSESPLPSARRRRCSRSRSSRRG
jgi:hypothetical protein